VLAVGDAEFQRKCLGKMEEVSRREGRTILVVSHNMGVVTGLCTKALWIHQGIIHDSGDPGAVIGRYLNQMAPDQDRLIQLARLPREPWLADDRLRFECLEWLTSLPPQHGEPVRIRLHFEVRAPVAGASIYLGLNSLTGTRVLTYQMDQQAMHRDLDRRGRYWVDLIIDPLILGPDIYDMDISCRSGGFHVVDSIRGCTRLEVIAGPRTPALIAQGSPGVRLEGAWSWDPATAFHESGGLHEQIANDGDHAQH
jgi:lipopolysaccharide transport system ATP-binding protein